jgi:hypothetical protein
MTEMLRGKLGYVVGGGYRVAADESHYYVRFNAEGGGLSIAAIRHGGRVPAIPDLDVEVVRDPDGLLSIVSAGIADAVDGGSGSASVGVHEHGRFSAMPYLSDDRLRLKLRAEIGDGLRVRVERGIVHHRNKPLAWDGSDIDLASPDLRPTTADHQAWCVIGLNPNTLALIAVSGTSQPRAAPLTWAQIAAVPFNWDAHIALCAVRLRAGALSLDETDIEALLHSAYGGASWLPGGGASAGWSATNVTPDKTFDANATTLDELADVVGTLIQALLDAGFIRP